MKTLIIYDSYFGNTEKIAKAIADSLKGETLLAKVENLKINEIKNYDLIIVGSPTRAFTYSDRTRIFLTHLPVNALKGKKYACFDTRIDISKNKSKLLKLAVKIFGYADKKIEVFLKGKGGTQFTESTGFFVEDKEGPLSNGEIEKASKWINLK